MLKRFFILMFIIICSISILGCESEEEKVQKQATSGGGIDFDKIEKEKPIQNPL